MSQPSPNDSASPKTSGGSPFIAAFKRSLRQPRFVVAAVVLLVAGVGLNATTQFLKLHFRKLPVPLRVPSLSDPSAGVGPVLDGDAAGAGKWVQISKDEILTSEVEQVLATKEHISRDYLDTRAISKLGEANVLRGKSPSEWLAVASDMRNQPEDVRHRFLAEASQLVPGAVVRLHVAYYTGMADTVAHIPDRCYVADGYEPSSYERVDGPFGKYADGSPREADFRFIHFDDQTGQGRVSRYVGYMFHVNGKYQSDPLMVRADLQNLLEKYGYYAKVELMVTGNPKDVKGKDAAEHAMRDFMTASLPEVERVLPDWQRVVSGK